jgi:putative Mg2+ transporter-C (MgtC) family protein
MYASVLLAGIGATMLESLSSMWANSWDPTLRLTMAALVGAAIGLNRDLRNKPAGVRTIGLVSLSSAMLVLSLHNSSLRESGGGEDAVSRVIQGLVTGVGFLGAGVIIRDGTSRVRGLTTAAVIWFAAGIGIVCGVGNWPILIVSVVLMFALLLGGGPLERLFHRLLGKPEPDDHRQSGTLDNGGQ